ncbi:helix-turn-helix domain-containing protein [Phenylobacterium montanum]|uniref:Helix-turn-helix transcriptional regulator n=1 Tax=Phenylobacterium montanum TaxID=2823693 RepID=A0A975G4S6_9CAUL|nr:helix-turn-helix transcriptional regulator [Caulobacter sp. S6]QUD90578.1 helix-turn-helix transcriptional regulator [Caulobacter sp. S6]
MRRWVSSPSYRATLETLVAARYECGLSQKAVADILGKPPSFIAKIDLGERRLDLVEFVTIARALGLTPEDLMARIAAKLPGDLEF